MGGDTSSGLGDHQHVHEQKRGVGQAQLVSQESWFCSWLPSLEFGVVGEVFILRK